MWPDDAAEIDGSLDGRVNLVIFKKV
ncbi:hypothetical protein CCACVL1_30472 [Corchorus capsularis]|uniref:Uncharacterized protein n=1 Tax=Corchorus capsularis TaxID=210143 RepID=A0A1R3FX20_COCAP|nr:hypothetical protein CCACVL1_30472 [Corchorus capsularis]